MSGKAKIAVAGVSGRMGQMLVETVTASDLAELSGATEHPDHAWVGKSLFQALGSGGADLNVLADPAEAFRGSDAVLDFTSPAASVEVARIAAAHKFVHVIGTTGFSDGDLAEIAKCSEETVIVRAGNMSLGINLLQSITKSVAAALGTQFDIEVVEAHHRHKVDAPSGTALMLGEAAAAGRGVSLRDVSDRGRDGQTGPRTRGHIGFSAIRGGDVVGEHDVIFAGEGERIVLRHVATDRGIYAQGALAAALWGMDKPSGEYNLADVLGM